MEEGSLPFQPAPLSQQQELSRRAWNLLGGMKWEGIEAIAEVLGIEDVERLILDLVTIRDFQSRSED